MSNNKLRRRALRSNASSRGRRFAATRRLVMEALEERIVLSAELLTLEPLGPVGSQLFGGRETGSLATAGASTSYEVDLAGGQWLTALLRPGFDGRVEVFDTNGGSLGFGDGSAGAAAVLNSLAIDASGTYRIDVSSLDGTGDFALDLVLNAGIEAESYGDGTNDSTNSAQELGIGEAPLGDTTADRLAVVGVGDGEGSADYYWFTLAPGASMDLGLAGADAAGLRLSIYDDFGTLVAVGVGGSTEYGQTVTGLTNLGDAEASYYARVDAASSASYGLIGLRGGGLSAEIDAAPLPLGPSGVAAGGLGAGVLGQTDATGDPVTMPTTLTDGDGFAWDVRGDGSIGDGTNDAYNGGLYLWVSADGATGYLNTQTQAGTEMDGRELVIGPEARGGVVVSRKVHVPDGSGQGFARFLERFSNTTDQVQNVSAYVWTNLGSGPATNFVGTSSGQGWFGVDDNWVVTDDGDGTGDPTLAHVIAGPGGLRPSYANLSSGALAFQFDLVLQPGETRSILHFEAQTADQATALERAADLVGLPTEALAGLTDEELAEIANFQAVDTQDQYEFWAEAGDALNIGTFTPGDGGGAPNNDLDPTLILYAPDGSQVALDEDGAADGRNATIDYTVPAGEAGLYRLVVQRAAGSGAYALAVVGATGATASASVVSIEPSAPTQTAPTEFVVTFATDMRVDTVSAADLVIDGSLEAESVEALDGRSFRFTFDSPPDDEGWHDVVYLGGATGLAGGIAGEFDGGYEIDLTGPSVEWSWPSGDAGSSAYYVSLAFDESIDPASVSIDDVTSFFGPSAGGGGGGGEDGGAFAGSGGVDLLDSIYQVVVSDSYVYIYFYDQYTPGAYELTFGPDVTDLAGNAMDGPYVATFSIGADVDLEPTSITAPEEVRGGEYAAISYEVRNNGEAMAEAGWYDVFYLSPTEVFDYETATEIDSYYQYRALEAGETYWTDATIYVPDYLATGDYYLFVVSDGYSYLNDLDRSNNALGTPVELAAPDVDLQVVSASAPSEADAGQSITVNFTVTNAGTTTTTNYYYDAVYYSTDAVFDVSDRALNSRYAYGVAGGASYDASMQVTIPKYGATDSGYLLVMADGYFYQPETDETNNVLALPITVHGPDLVVIAATLTPTEGTPGDSFSYSYTVQNQGDRTAASLGYDYIYLSTDATLDSGDSNIGYNYAGYKAPLVVGATYQITGSLTIPAWATDAQRYVLFTANRYFDSFSTPEIGDPANNVEAVAVALNPPNLTPTAISGPSEAITSGPLAVTWTVANTGSTAAKGDWYDYFYLSTDDVYGNGDDISLGSIYTGASTPLAPGASYTLTQDLTIPYNVTSGTYRIIVRVDGGGAQGETNENDNVLVSAGTVVVHAPDLTVASASAPATGVVKGTVQVDYRVENISAYNAPGVWYDYIYFSTDQTLDSGDSALTSIYRSGGLAAGAGYDVSQAMTLPNVAPGTYYLFVKTNAYYYYYSSYQGETDYSNNARLVGSIQLDAPDLKVTAATAPTFAVVNSVQQLTYTVLNDSAATAVGGWYDGVYLSTDDAWSSNDTLITYSWTGSRAPLAGGGTYTATINATIPNVAAGNYYLIFKADGYYSNYQWETNENNNTFSLAIGIGKPDLTLTTATAPAQATVGGNVDVTYQVKNIGESQAPGPWYDYIYLSNDATLSSDDQWLDYRWNSANVPLAAGASYDVSRTVTMPVNSSLGAKYLIFVADRGNNQGETNENNNAFSLAITLVAPDLTVESASAPLDVIPGGATTVDYRVTNLGAVATTRNWTDRIYYSVDGTLDSGDIWLVNVASSPLAAGAHYDVSQGVTIPGSAALGAGFLIVQTDSFGEQGETDETNNVRTIPIIVGAPDLTITAATAPATATLGSTIQVSWTVKNEGATAAGADWTDRVYLSSDATIGGDDLLIGSFYTGDLTPLAAGASYDATINVNVGDFPPGARYLLIVTDGGAVQSEGSETNNLQALAIALDAPDLIVSNLAVAPTTPQSGELITVSWTTANQGDGPTAPLFTERVVIRNVANDDVLYDGYVNYEPATSGAIPAGGSRERSVQVRLPDGRRSAGGLRVTVTTDVYNTVPEYRDGLPTNENNTATLDFTGTLAPYAELALAGVAAPTAAASGTSVPISWTIANQGDKAASGPWSDRVYLATDAAGTNRILFGTFEFAGTIQAGGSVVRTQNINLPNDLKGDYYVVVATDVFGQVFELDETNNAAVSTQPMTVSLSPFPNLVVSSVTAPSGAFSSQVTTVNFTVTNTGAAPTSSPYWYDSVYLSIDPALDGNDVFLGNSPNQSYLNPGETYSASLDVRMPRGISGPYYLIVKADAGNAVYEYLSENDNVAASAVFPVTLTPPPDFQVDVVNAPAMAFSGQPITIGWTVSNHGEGRNLETSWYDYLYRADDANGANPLYLGAVHHTGALDPDESYQASLTVNLPIGQDGDYFFYVTTDATNAVYEHLLDQNNSTIADRATKVLLTPPPDLEVEAVTAPSAAAPSRPASVSYMVSNYGSTTTPNGSWTDALYFSTDATLDAGDRLVASRPHYGALAVGDFYEGTFDFKLADNFPAGSYYAIVKTDSATQVFELDRDNNVAAAATPTAVVPDPADLVVSVPPGAVSGEAGGSVTITWTVLNQGLGSTPVDHWTDVIVASRDAVYGNGDDIRLGAIRRDGELAPGASYARTETFGVPFAMVGQYQLFVMADRDYEVYEANEKNNVSAAGSLTVSRKTPDLAMGSVSAAGAVASGSDLAVSWTVSNPGVGKTNSNYWYDYVYLSRDGAVSSDDVYLGGVQRSGALEAGASYTMDRSLKTPINASGVYYVIVRTDATDLVLEASESNNAGVSAAVAVTLTPRPDLTATVVDAPDSALSGRPIDVSWTVKNLDGNAAGSWYDSVYLSRDQVFDRDTDTYLGYRGASGPLAGGATYDGSGSFNLPQGISGLFYVFVVPNAGGGLDEAGRTGNNPGFDPMATLVSISPPADLLAGSIDIPTNGTPGRQATITYSVSNEGENPAPGGWWDSLYLSADDVWDPGDALFSRVYIGSTLAAGASYQQSVTAALPGVDAGAYRVILRSDIRNNVRESDETNNISASLLSVELDAEALELGVPRTAPLAEGLALYYKINIGAGEALKVSLSTPAADAANELFVRYKYMPSRSRFDQTGDQPFLASPQVIVPETGAGTYYILVYTSDLPPGTDAATITASVIPFSVLSVESNELSDQGPSTVKVRGGRFTADTEFRLVGPGGTIASSSATVADSSTAYVRFDLQGAALGSYAMEAVRPDDSTASLAGAVRIVAGQGPVVSLGLEAPTQMRPMTNILASLQYGNSGGADTPAPLLIIESKAQGVVSLSHDGLVDGAPTSVFAVGASLDGPINLLRPGAIYSLPFFFRSPATAGASTDVQIRSIWGDDDSPITDWATIEASSRPEGVAPAEWDRYWSGIQPRIGGEWGDYVRFIGRLAARYAEPGNVTRDVRALFGKLYAEDPNGMPAYEVSGRLLDAATGAPLAGVDVALYGVVDGRDRLAGSTKTDAQGRYSIGGLQPGDFSLAIAVRERSIYWDEDRDGDPDDDGPAFTLGAADAALGDHYAMYPVEAPGDRDSRPTLLTDAAGGSHIFWMRDRIIWHARFDGSAWVDAAPIPGTNAGDFVVQAADNLIDGTDPGVFVSWTSGEGGNTEDVFYLIGRPDGSGGFQWSSPIHLTDDEINDSKPTITVTDDGKALVTYVKRDASKRDDGDLYFNLLQVDGAALVFAMLGLTPDGLADAADFNAAGGSTGLTVKPFEFKGELPTKGIFAKLAEGKFSIKGEISDELSCPTYSASGSLSGEITGKARGSKPNGPELKGSLTGTYKEEWKLSQKECVYKFDKQTFSLSGSAGISWKTSAFGLITNLLPPGAGLAASLIIALLEKKLGIEDEASIGFQATLGGSIFYAKEPTFPGRLLPDGGEVTADFEINAGANIGNDDVKLTIGGKVALQTSIIPIAFKGVSGEIAADIEVGAWKLTFKYAASTADSLDAAYGAEAEPFTYTFVYDPSLLVGTTDTHLGGGNAAVLSTVGSDVLEDASPVQAKGPDGVIRMAWIKTLGADDGGKGSRVLVSAFDQGTRTWSTPAEVPGSRGFSGAVQIAYAPDGTPIVVWSMADASALTDASTAEEVLAARDATDLYFSTLVGGAWTTAETVYPPNPCGNDAPALGIDALGQLLVAWNRASDSGAGSLMVAAWNGSSFSAAAAIDAGAHLGKASIGVVAGKTVIFYTEDTDPAESAVLEDVYFRTFDAGGGTWGAQTLFDPALAASALDALALSTTDATGSIDDDARFDVNTLFSPPTPDEKCCPCKGKVRTITIQGPCKPGGGQETKFDEKTCTETIIVYQPCVIRPSDPNDMLGPEGFGDDNWITDDEPLGYTIRFENQASASAPAQEVVITQTLDSDLDPRSFRLGDFSFRGLNFQVPENSSFYADRLNLFDEYGFDVDVFAAINVKTGEATWTLTTIDPATGEKPLDPSIGFLPINKGDDLGMGEGSVSYTVKLRRATPTGTRIDAQARIVFDTEGPIDTPAIFNTIDADTPTSAVAALPATAAGNQFVVQWDGDDPAGGSALRSFAVYVSINGGTPDLWLADVSYTQALYDGEAGTNYRFFSRALDNAGNLEAAPEGFDAETTTPGGRRFLVAPATDLTTSENGLSAQFAVRLAVRPQGVVKLSVASGNPAEGAVSTTELVFTPDDWDRDHVVTVSGVDDGVVDGDRAYQVLLALTSSADPNFEGFALPVINVVNLDNETGTPTDTTPPSSAVAALPAVQTTTNIALSWSGDDDSGSAGLVFDIYVAIDGGAFAPIPTLIGTSATSGVFVGEENHSYAFYSMAMDPSGNREAPPATADATTRVPDLTGPSASPATVQDGARGRSFVDRLSWTFSEATNIADLISAGTIAGAATLVNLGVDADADPDAAVVLRADQFQYNAATRTLVWTLEGSSSTLDTLANGYFKWQFTGALITDAAGNALSPRADGFWRLEGDVNGDMAVSKPDKDAISAALGGRPGNGLWNPSADLNRDLFISNKDRILFDRILASPSKPKQIIPPQGGLSMGADAIALAPPTSGARRFDAESRGDVANVAIDAPTITLAAAGTTITTFAGQLQAWIGSTDDLDWFRLAAPVSGTFTATARAEGGDPGLTIYQLVGAGASAGLRLIDQAAGSATATLVAGREYFIRVAADAAGVRSYALDLSLAKFDDYLALIGADAAKADRGLDGSGYAVAVIDTGVDYNAPGLAGRVILGPDFGSGDNDPMDTVGHGTHVAGIIASTEGHAAGLAAGAKIVAVKITPDGSTGTTLGTIRKALQWVLANRLRYNITAINLSFGGGNVPKGEGPDSLEPLYKALADAGVFIAVSAGNGNAPGAAEGLNVLSASTQVAAVGASWDSNAGAKVWATGARDYSTDADRVASFSQRAEGLDLIAPGGDILNLGLGGSLIVRNGTSMAAPMVAGAAVLVRQAADSLGLSLSTADILAILKATGASLFDGDDERVNVSASNRSYSRIDVDAAIASLLGDPSFGPLTPLGVSSRFPAPIEPTEPAESTEPIAPLPVATIAPVATPTNPVVVAAAPAPRPTIAAAPAAPAAAVSTADLDAVPPAPSRPIPAAVVSNQPRWARMRFAPESLAAAVAASPAAAPKAHVATASRFARRLPRGPHGHWLSPAAVATATARRPAADAAPGFAERFGGHLRRGC